MATSHLRKVSRSAVGVEGRPVWVRCSDNAEQDNTLYSQLVYLKAPRREWVRPRYIAHSVGAHCGHTVVQALN